MIIVIFFYFNTTIYIDVCKIVLSNCIYGLIFIGVGME